MRRCRTTAILTSLLIMLSSQVSAEGYSVGVGVGSLYSGLGLNIAKSDQDSLGFLAAGCVAHDESDDNKDTACGIGVGWIKAVDRQVNGKHAIGVYLGPVTADHPSPGQVDPVYGIGIPYVFFFSGIAKSGVNLGLTPAVGWNDDETMMVLRLQMGVQF